MNHREMAQTLRDAGYTVIAPHDKASIRKETETLLQGYVCKSLTRHTKQTRRSYPRAMLKSAEEVLREMGMIK